MTAADKLVRLARQSLRSAADRACVARGEAQWTNGYRTALRKTDEQASDDLYEREMSQFKTCSVAEAKLERAIRRYAQVIRQSMQKPKRRAK